MVSNRTQKILAGWFKALDLKSTSVFLVGGAVRDHLLRRPCADLDLVCRDADGFARRLADSCGAALVRFEKKPGETCFRIIDRENPDDFLDLVELRNANIIDDLARRDFTINAMAIPVYNGGRLGNLVDPHDGLSDLNRQIVRVVGSETFRDDPLRILRAWRFAAELEFRIDMTTRKQLTDQAPGLKTVAVERCVYELFRIFSVANAGKIIRDMAGTPVLDVLFPEKTGTLGNPVYPDVWNNVLAVMDALETILGSMATYFGATGSRVTVNFSAGNRLQLLKIAAFYYDISPSDVGMIERMAERVARRLKLSNRDRSFFQCVLAGFGPAFAIAAGQYARPRLIEFFKARADDGVGALVLGIAVLSADTVGVPAGIERQSGIQLLCSAIVDYYSGIRAKLAEKDLVGGKDLIDSGMSSGPRLGAVLREVRRAQDEGAVTTRSEALQWAHKFISPED